MLSVHHILRRGLAAALTALYVALSLATGIHDGPHFESDVVWLPIDLHHHDYGFTEASAEPARSTDLCVACQLSRLVPRLPAPAQALPHLDATVVAALSVPDGEPRPTDLDPLGPRAPPAL
jgi:hypothetical protein